MSTTAGFLMPLAYNPHVYGASVDARPVLDFVVTHDFAARNTIACRFYPQSDGYQSTSASTVSFVLTRAIPEGSFLRLAYTTLNGMTLSSRIRNGDWYVVSTAEVAAYICNHASVFVYTTGLVTGCALQGICAAAFTVDGVAPVCIPDAVLPCKYVTVQPAPDNNEFVYAKDVVAVPTNWLVGAWQALKWGRVWTAVAYTDASSYESPVDTLEDALTVVLTPGQLVPIAYKPYYGTASPSFPGEVACVVTTRISPSTAVFVYCNTWDNGGGNVPTYYWSTPIGFGLDPGTVVVFGGLGTAPRINYGRLETSTPPVAGQSLTAFTFADTSGTYVITGVYSCAYRGEVPRTLQPGVSILNKPWPDCPSVLAVLSCKPVCKWLEEMVSLNHLCAVRWLCQPLPSFRCCSRRGCGCCCYDVPPSMFATTTSMLAGGC